MKENKFCIAIVTPRMVVGGAESYTIAKARYLVEHGYKVLVVSAGGENVQNLPSNVTHYTLEWIDRAPYELKKRERVKVVNLLTTILQENEVTVIETHNTYPVYYGALAAKRARIACLYNLLNELSHRKQKITNLLVQAFSRGNAYFTLTHQMNEYVERKLRTQLNPTVIPIPVEVTACESTGTTENYILTVCRFSPDKMYVKWLIEGFAEALTNESLPQGMLLKVVGNGDLKTEIEQCAIRANVAAGYDAVQLLGFRTGNELESLYEGCRIYIGMGTTLLKAAQKGKAVVMVGLEEPQSQFAWGYWGENPIRDAHSLAEQGSGTEGKTNKMSFADALSIATHEEKLRDLGNKAKILFETHYEFGKIMKEWENQYHRIACSQFAISNQIEKQTEFRIFVLRPLWEMFQYIKRLK